MATSTIASIDPAGMRALVRVDFNVPIKDGTIRDDRRIRAALPTIQSILDRGGSVVLMSHLGRPKGEGLQPDLSLAPVAERLGELLDAHVEFPSDDCIDDEAAAAAQTLEPGGVLLLENLRFHTAEKTGDAAFAATLAGYGDFYVNDAFGTCHRADASMVAVPRAMEGKPRVAGLLVEKELRFLRAALDDPPRAFIVVLGGAKVSTKIAAIENLLPKCDAMLIGGAMAYTFLRARGEPVGSSLVEDEHVETARRALQAAEDRGVPLQLPSDHIVSKAFEAGAETWTTSEIPDGAVGIDIGPQTAGAYAAEISTARTVLWNGPMGVFEWPGADGGSRAVAEAMASATKAGATTIAGGGDSAAALDAFGLVTDITHVSTGGGASVEMLEGKRFEAIELLDQAG
ncbi:MAG: phosphoglycerate kinase [Planctomycetota bacterium]